MLIFETDRLIVKKRKPQYQSFFVELFSDPDIIDPIPQPQLNIAQVLDRFVENPRWQSPLEREKSACGIFEKGNPEMIGPVLFLTNDENEKNKAL